jgi:uncharacterized protein involved in propanediol utilization
MGGHFSVGSITMPREKSSQDRGRPKHKVGASAASRKASLRVGIGHAIAHHGELLQGVFEGEDGHLRRGLVTLPLTSRQSLVTFWPRDSGSIRTRPRGRGKAVRAAALTLDHLGYSDAAGDLTIESHIPIGHGYGSSTADVVATIRAVAAGVGATLRRSTVCRLAVAAEEACDAVAYEDQVVLFAQREGYVIEHFAGEFPPLLIVGFRSGDDSPVDTLHLPPARYNSEEIEQFRALRGMFCHAIRRQDPRLLGRIATASARISQRHLEKSHFDATLERAETHGACGIQVAHSGTLMGVLFDANEIKTAPRARELAAGLRRGGFEDVTIFSIGMDRAPPS